MVPAAPQTEAMLGQFTQNTPNKRRRTTSSGGNSRICPHCGRSFKRTEHLERHVRTHTKEKPFGCRCGAAFARRDLLTRHERVSGHENERVEDVSSADVTHLSQDLLPQHVRAAEADVAAAVSLSGLSGDPWVNQPALDQVTAPVVGDQGRRDIYVDAGSYSQGLLSPQLFDHGVDFDPHFREFANFLDGVGLPAEWSPYFHGPDKINDVVEDDSRDVDTQLASPRQGSRTRPGTPFSSWLPSAPTGNRLTNSGSDARDPRAAESDTQQYKVTEEHRSRINVCLGHFSDALDPSFKLPSRHALTRYMASFFEGFHSHMPYIHTPTWNILDHSIELVFGIAAIGAQYCFEHGVSERLFFAGKSILLERLSQFSDRLGPRTKSSLALLGRRARPSHFDETDDEWSPIEAVRALIALMGFATWEPKASMVQEAFALQSLLTQILRDIGIDDVPEPVSSSRRASRSLSVDSQWREWVDEESCRRTKLIAFSFLHTHSIAYNVHPVLPSNEVNLRLPCCTAEWKAATASQWQAARKEVPKQQLFFQEALSLLLKNDNCSAPLDPIPTPLGNYVLLHGLLQRIHLVRDLSFPAMSSTAALPPEEVEKLERGLRSWTSGWQQAPESSLNPNNENGPIPFTSSSLLALAYVRIYLHLGPHRQLDSRDPAAIAQAIGRSPDVERSDGVIAALLYAAHMLSIPVRLGVDRVARSQAFFWSVRHSLASLDCSILLSKWLATLADTVGSTPVTDSEDRILHWVRCVVEEAFTVVDFEGEEDIHLDFRDPMHLSLAVLRIWAHFFKRNSQWPFINIIGKGLEGYREALAHKMASRR